jgi:hypothetical protein
MGTFSCYASIYMRLFYVSTKLGEDQKMLEDFLNGQKKYIKHDSGGRTYVGWLRKEIKLDQFLEPLSASERRSKG